MIIQMLDCSAAKSLTLNSMSQGKLSNSQAVL